MRTYGYLYVIIPFVRIFPWLSQIGWIMMQIMFKKLKLS